MFLDIKIHYAFTYTSGEAIARLAPQVKEEVMAKMIFVNLPVRNLAASTALYVAIGRRR